MTREDREEWEYRLQAAKVEAAKLPNDEIKAALQNLTRWFEEVFALEEYDPDEAQRLLADMIKFLTDNFIKDPDKHRKRTDQ